MAMNYLGNLSLLDRGDAPAQKVIDRYHQSKSQRVADETKEELEAVLKRVDSIYGHFEHSSNLHDSSRAANTEYVNDLAELEALIKDQVKKKKYQQQVNIFIVGYEKVCGQKLKLLQQVNEFFTDNSSMTEDDDLMVLEAEREQFDLEEMAEAVENTLTTCQSLAERLGELNHEMADYMDRVVSTKATNKSKKKLEKALSQARSEIEGLNDKLTGLIQEIENKEEKIQQMFKQIELKNMEAQRYKTAAEVAKKSAEESERLREEIAARDRVAVDLRRQMDQLQLEVGQIQNSREQSKARNLSQQQDAQSRLGELQKTMEQRQIDDEERRRELQRVHETQIAELKEATRRELEQLRQGHGEEIKRILTEQSKQKVILIETEPKSKAPTREESRASIKNNKQDTKPARIVPAKNKRKETKGTSQDEAGPSDTSLPAVIEPEADFNAQLPLDDAAWAVVSPVYMASRFEQYRGRSLVKIRELQEKIDVTINRTVEKITNIKAQYHEHKDKWMLERAMLVAQVEQADEHREQAEGEADTTLGHMEAFISEQESMELEEEVRRAELEAQAAGMLASTGASLEEARARLTLLEGRREEEALERSLMQQTDDAKAELSRLNSAKTSHLDDQPDTDEDDWFPKYKQSVLESISGMLDSEKAYAANQRNALRTLRRLLLVNTSRPISRMPIGLPEVEEEEKSPDGTAARPATMAGAEVTAAIRTASTLETLVTSREVVQTRVLYTLAAHVAMETERLGVDPASVYQALAQLYTQSLSELKADGNMMFSLPSQGQTSPDRLRKVFLSSAGAGGSSSARSRTSHHRTILTSLRASAEDRRSRSPTVHSILSQKSVLSDVNVDEVAELTFLADNVIEGTFDMGTSPMTPRSLSSRKGVLPPDHPVVKEYLRCYESIVNFKENLAQLFMDREHMTAGDVLNDMEPVTFDEGSKIQPQIEQMTTSALKVLEEAASLINNAFSADQEYQVSSLDMSSRNLTRMLSTRERTPETSQSATKRASDNLAAERDAAAKDAAAKDEAAKELAAKEVLMLKERCEQLKGQLADEGKRHDDEVHHNTIIIMEMQNSINALRRELSIVAKNAASPEVQQSLAESPVMFTRLDSERNAKTMKRAVNERRLHSDNYKSAVNTMKEYISLPAKRFVHLVHKYVHHRQMKQIEENVSNSKSLNDDVFMILDKMESLQNTRAQKWADKMDSMGAERLRLASLLMDTLDSIERQSGIFLIKPMFSYRGNSNTNAYMGAVNTSYSSVRDIVGNPPRHTTSSAPVPTPTSNVLRGMGGDSVSGYTASTRPVSAANQHGGEVAFVQSMAGEESPRTWNPGMSQMQSHQALLEENHYVHSSYMNTPRLLELDINRMLIGQNQISSNINPNLTSDNHLTQSNVRSYMTVNRPSGSILPKVDSWKGGKESGLVSRSADGSVMKRPPAGSVMIHSARTPPLPPISACTADATRTSQTM